MRLLTRNETESLQHALKDIALPETATLYVSLGINQVFRRVSREASDHFENSWLYIPRDVIETARKIAGADKQSNPDCVSSDPIPLDEYSLYPVWREGAVVAVIVDRRNRKLKFNRKCCAAILQAMETYEMEARQVEDDAVEAFVSVLFQHDSTLERFIKRLLKLLTAQFENGFGGVYYYVDGTYQLRIAVGDIARCDKLPCEVSLDTAEKWIDSINRGELFIPAEILPPHPTFLTVPPDFWFVHSGVRSERNHCLTVLAVSGDIQYGSIKQITKLADMASRVHESQFVPATDILTLYNALTSLPQKPKSLEDILVKVFRLLEANVVVTRMVWAHPTLGTMSIKHRPNALPTVTHDDGYYVDAKVIEHLRLGNEAFVAQFDGYSSDDAADNQCYIDEVRSEIYFALQPGEPAQGVLAIGAPVNGDYLQSVREFLLGIAHFARHMAVLFVDLRPIGEGHSAATVSGCERGLLCRYDTMGKLVGGYYHDIFGLMSVIIGQTEILESGLTEHGGDLPVREVANGLQRIGQAADEITLYLNNLKEIFPKRTDMFAQTISCREFLGRLPALLRGYARHIQDSRNIFVKLEVDTSTKIDFDFTMGEIYDYFLPLLLILMDTSNRSAILMLRMEAGQREDSLVVEFDQGILGMTGLSRMLERLFVGRRVKVMTDHSGVVEFGAIFMSYGVANDRLYRFTFVKQRTEAEELWKASETDPKPAVR